MAARLKVYELAKELNQESRNILEVAQRLGINIKNPTSVIGSEEARMVRDYYKKTPPVTRRKVIVRSSAGQAAADPVAAAPSAPKEEVAAPKAPGTVTTERRVGQTVIRRRKKAAPEPVVEEVPEPVETAAEGEVGAPQAEEDNSETIIEVQEESVEVVETAASGETEEAPTAAPTRRVAFPSIIKKVSTDQHLEETIGAKPKKRERPTKDEAAAEDSSPKRVREIDVVMAAAAPETKEAANKRRMLQRQSGVFRSADFLKRELIRSGKKKKPALNRPAQKTLITTRSARKRVVEMGETISLEDLAKAMGVKAKQLQKKLGELGTEIGEKPEIDFDTATIVAADLGYSVKQNIFKEEEFLAAAAGVEDDTNKVTRAPVVTIMGHVDHGKTSLLDKIRKAKVAEGEAGGITQHIGAYSVPHKDSRITFVDTPGHEAFTAMRARGAGVTDIVILVVSATEGPMPQTVESINHAKAAGVPIIVAVNKTDLPDANPDKTKQALANYELNPEEWGGDTIYVSVSAKTGKGIDQLLESVLLHAELLELKADPTGAAQGVIVESRMEKGRGPVATVLVQSGTLRPGDIIACGLTFGKVRAINDFQGKRLDEAGPSDPVEIIGLSEIVSAGDSLNAVKDERSAREVVDARKAKMPKAEDKAKMTLEQMLAGAVERKQLRAVLKSDVQGSVEALKESLSKFPKEKVDIKFLHTAVGGITESDVMLAAASDGVVFGFNVRPDAKAKAIAEREGVEIRCYRVIYELVDDVKKLLEGLVEKTVVERVIGHAEVRDVFNIPKIGAVAGSSVTDGKFIRGCHVRLVRDSRVIYQGRCASLRRFKDDVKEVTHGHECGIGLENFNDIKNGDRIEAFEKDEIAGTL